MLIAIGGGEIRKKETWEIDKFVVESTGKAHPNLLFIPTASGDDPDYVRGVTGLYGKRLGCQVKPLLLHPGNSESTVKTEFRDAKLGSSRISRSEILELVDWADCFYVGGGNTRMLVKIWRENGLDALLKAAHVSGKTLSGLSAGAICWFEHGLSDSEKFDGRPDWNYIRVDALGFLPGSFGPHHDERMQEPKYLDFLSAYPGEALAADNGCALVFDGSGMKVLRSLPKAKAWRISGGKAEEILS